MRKLEFTIAGFDERRRRRQRDETRGRIVTALVVVSLFVLASRPPQPPVVIAGGPAAANAGGPAAANAGGPAVAAPVGPQPVAPAQVVTSTQDTTRRPNEFKDSSETLPRSPPLPLPPPAARITARPDRLSFGALQTGARSTTLQITLTNGTDRILHAGYSGAEGEQAADFTVSNCNDFYYAKAGANGSSCSIFVSFQPGGPGPRRSSIVIRELPGSAAQGKLVTLELEGEGVAAALDFAPTLLDFRDRPVQTVTLKNSGAVAVRIDGASFTGPDAAQFRLESNACAAGSLASGSQCAVSVRHRISAKPAHTAEMRIDHSAPGSPARVQLVWEAPKAPAFAADPLSLDFGSVTIGRRLTKNITFTNTGSADATTVAVAIIGSTGNFSVDQNGCAQGLAQGARCTVVIAYAPKNTASHVSTLLVTGNGLSGSATFSMSGTGVQPGTPAGVPPQIN